MLQHQTHQQKSITQKSENPWKCCCRLVYYCGTFKADFNCFTVNRIDWSWFQHNRGWKWKAAHFVQAAWVSNFFMLAVNCGYVLKQLSHSEVMFLSLWQFDVNNMSYSGYISVKLFWGYVAVKLSFWGYISVKLTLYFKVMYLSNCYFEVI